MNIDIPEDIVEKLTQYIAEEKKFSSLQEYVVFLLRQVVEKLGKINTVDSSKEEEKVVKRLRDLGYI